MTHAEAQKTMAQAMNEQASEPCNGTCVLGFVFAVVVVAISIWLYLGRDPVTFLQELEVVEFNARAKRLDAAKQELCGPNASWIDVDPTTIQCFTKRGRATKRASL